MTPQLPTLQYGVAVPEVGNWQRYLNRRGYTDEKGRPLEVDEVFGQNTAFATRRYQAQRGITELGIVDPLTRKHALLDGFIPFVQAKNLTYARPGSTRTIRLIVLHTMENKEKPSAAEDVAFWFAGQSTFAPPKASAHFCVDEDSVIQCVRVRDIAWHAEGANHDGIGVEHAGTARQTREEWNDGASLALLARSACLSADLLREHDLPVKKLSAKQVHAGERGFCGHHDITLAYPGPGRSHWDPGPHFPWEDYIAMVKERA